jgi:hypothetical protein
MAFAVVSAALILLSICGGQAAAQNAAPAAVVEEVSEGVGVRAFDYLWVGDEVVLDDDQTIVLGYLRSCERESVSGGALVVGERASVVTGGRTQRETVDCDGGQVELSRSEAAASGVVVFRNDADTAAPLQIFSTTPVFTFASAAGGDSLDLKPRDGVSPALSLPIEGPVMDFQALGRKLKAGGIYEARTKDRTVTIKIVSYARPGGALIGRLVRF